MRKPRKKNRMSFYLNGWTSGHYRNMTSVLLHIFRDHLRIHDKQIHDLQERLKKLDGLEGYLHAEGYLNTQDKEGE